MRVGTYKSGQVYSLCMEIALRQTMVLKRTPTIEKPAATWHRRGVAMGGASRLQDARAMIINQLDFFIADYLSVNPKARPVTTYPLPPERRLDIQATWR